MKEDLEEQGALGALEVVLLRHPIARPPDLGRFAHSDALVGLRQHRLLQRLPRRTLGQILLMPLALQIFESSYQVLAQNGGQMFNL